MKQIVRTALNHAGLLLLAFRLLGCSDASFVETRSEQSDDATGVGAADSGNPDGSQNPEDPLAPGDDSSDPESPNYLPDGTDGSNNDSGNNLPPLTEVEIKDRCKNSETQSRKVTVSFPNPAKQCEWGKAGNLDLIQGVVTARHEATNDLAIAGDEVICGMQFSFAQQEIRYDDEISLLFNGRFLMHSVASDISYFEKQDGFYVYDWNRFVGQPYRADYSKINDYCIGAADGKGSCSMPPTETNGMIKLDFDEDVAFKLSALADKERKGAFTWVTTGDNDPATDCQHMDITFAVELTTAKK